MAVLYGATTVFFVVVFVRAFERHPHQIRTAVLGYLIFTAAATFGLWEESSWGRSLALIIALGTSALGAIATLSAIVSHKGPLVGAVVLFVVSTAVTYLLSLRTFRPDGHD